MTNLLELPQNIYTTSFFERECDSWTQEKFFAIANILYNRLYEATPYIVGEGFRPNPQDDVLLAIIQSCSVASTDANYAYSFALMRLDTFLNELEESTSTAKKDQEKVRLMKSTLKEAVALVRGKVK